MMMKYIAVAAVMMTGTAFGLTAADREIADQFLDKPTTIQFIEADPELMKLSPEEMYNRLDKDGVIAGIKQAQEIDWSKKHPELEDPFGKKNGYRIYEDMTGNQLKAVELPFCVAKRSGTFLTYIGPPSVQPWATVYPLMECVNVAQKQRANPKKCIIAACTPLYSMPGATTVAQMVRDILLGLYN